MASDPSTRARWLQALALANDQEMEAATAAFAVRPEAFETLRAPEVGLVMTRARAGGSGAPFNLGEATVTRSAVRSPDGMVGIGWVQGRRPRRSVQIARLDAVFQSAGSEQVMAVVRDMEAGLAERRAQVARKAAATRVDFITLVRGED
ncbi:phosphonate C-P lyase system protein PhnG [Geminicoccus roseus]|uniref:phosphonate C-P lyase system protein PhnG n=1 Tax=Geminicoccus roseus TaxID=404900 RepID=UPI000482E1FF|nr:phosphonate C-P lyase system protein PhnG [Geminicoccus roseus]